MYKIITFISFLLLVSSTAQSQIKVGCEQFDQYMPIIKGKKIGIVANQTTMCGDVHLVDKLHAEAIDIKYIFSPEHGFRGELDAGQSVENSKDQRTGIKMISLYGAVKSPPDSCMRGIDFLIYDLQDVGVRYFTYISTLKYCMEAAARNGKTLIVLDRPNPNGCYTDGPVLDMKYRSFVGEFPIPVVYGMTVGELAQMILGEGWLDGGAKCDLKIIQCKDYSHNMRYRLPVKPSPNLPDMQAVYLYPSTCYFEATALSVGRGTASPFKIFGHPNMKEYTFKFTPHSTIGAKNPPLKDIVCHGRDLSSLSNDDIISEGVNLEYIIEAYKSMGGGTKFFTSFFEKLVGVSYVRSMIIDGKTAEQIKAHWTPDITNFKNKREKYLLYD
ncbi:MAG: DUF1343 domain-containing protein [Rikenellaceae bacterium]